MNDIPIPVPHAAKVRAGFETLDVEFVLSQPVDRRDSAEAGADHQHVTFDMLDAIATTGSAIRLEVFLDYGILVISVTIALDRHLSMEKRLGSVAFRHSVCS